VDHPQGTRRATETGAARPGLGQVDWEHRFGPNFPVYMQVSRDALALHLSEHHGDGTPGSVVYVYMRGVEALHRELTDKNYRHNRPSLQQQEWGLLEMAVVDPFNNRIVFAEYRNHLKHPDGSLPCCSSFPKSKQCVEDARFLEGD
jgi:Glyoxalase superfamily protein